MSIDVMKQALEALEEACGGRCNAEYNPCQQRKAAHALRTAIDAAEKQEPVALEWDEVFDAAAAAYCRSEASRKALRLCFQTRQHTTQISIGWTANELMAFAKTIAYVCTTPPAAQREWIGLTDEEIEKGRDQTFSINNPYCPCDSKTMRKAVRWAEAKLKEKNT